MTPKELLDAARLDDAIRELTAQVRSRPTDTSARIFLFELLCFAGDLDRAGKQLEAIATQQDRAASALAVQVYRALLAAEQTRRHVFQGQALPKFVVTPPEYVERYVMLVKSASDGAGNLADIVAGAEDAAPAIAGEIEGRAFESFRDADDRVAPVLEVFHGAEYLWVPFQQIQRLRVSAPRTLRDLMWVHAAVETSGDTVGDVFIPVLYVNTSSHADSQVRLGRTTDWEVLGDGVVKGAGLRTFLVDGENVPIFGLRDVQFATAAAPSSP
jgi:type VI secretion system protein ImpE